MLFWINYYLGKFIIGFCVQFFEAILQDILYQTAHDRSWILQARNELFVIQIMNSFLRFENLYSYTLSITILSVESDERDKSFERIVITLIHPSFYV